MQNHRTTKDWYGEVFTPDILVQELLNSLPKQVWKNPHLQWLDPCAGTGFFFEAVMQRLMQSLSDELPNKLTRKRHIIKQMLFMYELNPHNVRELRLKFGMNANIAEKNFLEDKDQTMYDVVVANPPFQSPKTHTYEGSAGNRTLWDKFVVHALHKCVPKGFLAFITPSNWRRPEHTLYPLLTRSNTLRYLHIFGKKDGKTLFNVQSRFDLYVIQKTPHQSTHSEVLPTIIDEQGLVHRELDPLSWPFLPNYAYESFLPFLLPSPTSPVIYHSSMYDARKLSRRKTKNYHLPVIHTLTQQGMGILYAQENLGHFGQAKVILNVNEKQYPVNDHKGEYGMSQLSFGIPIRSKAEGDRIIKCIMSEVFQTMLRATKWSSFQTDYRMFKYIK